MVGMTIVNMDTDMDMTTVNMGVALTALVRQAQ